MTGIGAIPPLSKSIVQLKSLMIHTAVLNKVCTP